MTGAVLGSAGESAVARERVRLRGAREALLAVAVLGSIAVLLFRPWEALPFPIVDFGGWLVLLSSSDSAVAGFRSLVAEHAREGRVNVLSMLYVAVNWALFGSHPLGWQLLRAAILLGIIGAAYALVRKLGAGRAPALIGAAFFVLTDSARSVWMVPQAMEHVATLLVLMATLVAASYHTPGRAWRSASLIAAPLVLAIWVREPMVAAVPFVVLVALCHRGDGYLATPRIDGRSVLLVSIIGGAVALLNVVPVVAVRSFERATGYASRFGVENISVSNVKNVLAALTLPVTREPFFPANVMFILAIGVAAIGIDSRARRYRAMILLAASLPLCAALIYVMWPSFPGNYALPYIPATALAFSLALSTLWRGSSVRRGIAVVAAGVVVAYGVLLTINDRRAYASARFLDAEMARVVSETRSSHLIAAVDDPRLSGGFGRGLSLYAGATRGKAPPQASDVDCAAGGRLAVAPPPGALVVRPPGACENAPFPAPMASVKRGTSMIDWKTLRSRLQEATADFWLGERAR